MPKNETGIEFPYRDPPGLRDAGDEGIRRRARERLEDVEKLNQLCEYFQIPHSPEMYQELSLILARQLYGERKKPGKKESLPEMTRALLIVEVNSLISRQKTRSVNGACAVLARSHLWRTAIDADEGASIEKLTDILRKIYEKNLNLQQVAFYTSLKSKFDAGDFPGTWENLVTCHLEYWKK